MGMSMAGIIHVPVYTSLSRDEYRYIFQHSDARMVIVSDTKLYENIKPACDEVQNVQFVFTFNKTELAEHWMKVVDAGRNCIPATRKKLEQIKKEIKPSDPASLIYTSGTTGTSKGVMLSHNNLVKNFIAAAGVFNLTPDDRYLSILPLCQIGRAHV